MVKKNAKSNYMKGVGLTILLILLSAFYLTERFVVRDYIADFDSEIIKSFSYDGPGDFLIISKGDYKLRVYKNFRKKEEFNITIGKNHGNKRVPGDDRTPEGIFRVLSVENSSHWVYDFPDDTLPAIEGAYGPWFIRLDVPGFEGIGIHGFLNDKGLGKRLSNGCIRLSNEKLEDVAAFVKPGMLVIIEPSREDLVYDKKIIGPDRLDEPSDELRTDIDK